MANALLDGSVHNDTAAGTVARADLIVGNSTPAWARLAKGTANQFLRMDGTATDPAWTTVTLFTNSARHPYEFSAASLGNNAYLACDGGSTQASSGTISARRRFRARTAGTLSKLIVDLDTAPGAGNSRTFTIRINEVDSALAVTISNTDTLSSEDIDTVAAAAGDRIELFQTQAGTPAASIAHGVVETTYA